MKVAFDTSVLVAGLVASHPKFSLATVWLDALDSGEVDGFWTAHAFAETWSVLTRLPLESRIAPADVTSVLESLVELCPPTELTIEDYIEAARRAAATGSRSGVIFDALHLVAAERATSDVLLTFNESDFIRLAPQIDIRVPTASID